MSNRIIPIEDKEKFVNDIKDALNKNFPKKYNVNPIDVRLASSAAGTNTVILPWYVTEAWFKEKTIEDFEEQFISKMGPSQISNDLTDLLVDGDTTKTDALLYLMDGIKVRGADAFADGATIYLYIGPEAFQEVVAEGKSDRAFALSLGLKVET